MNTVVCLAPGPLDYGGHSALALAIGSPAVQPVTVLVVSRRTESILPLVPQGVRFLHLTDPIFALLDEFTLGQVIADVVRNQAASIVITGDSSAEEGLGLLPAAIAHHWPAPIMSQVIALDSLPDKKDRVAITVLAGGKEITLAFEGPMVVSVLPTIPSRIPSHIAFDPPAVVEEVTLDDFSIDRSELIPRPSLVGNLVPGPLPERLSIEHFLGRLSR